jgi:hypothetical protein
MDVRNVYFYHLCFVLLLLFSCFFCKRAEPSLDRSLQQEQQDKNTIYSNSKQITDIEVWNTNHNNDQNVLI